MSIFTRKKQWLASCGVVLSLVMMISLPGSVIAKVDVSSAGEALRLKESIVKIYTVANTPNYRKPWDSTSEQYTGSGSVIEGNRILTNAHVIANSTFVEVKRYGQTKRYEAIVDAVSHDADLAILKVKDEAFFADSNALPFGELPEIQQQVSVYGFPLGGDTLSVTEGVVSRIEHQDYVHSGERLISVQIDAAVNPGNSGGPVISDGKIVGVVMQKNPSGDNIGYMVPTPVIEHFFSDLKDGSYDGFPDIGITIQHMTNPVLRKRYKLMEDNSGVLVNRVLENSAAAGVLKRNDVITAIDGHRVSNNGTVEVRPREYTAFTFYVDQHQVGDTLKLSVLRDGQAKDIEFQLKNTSADFKLVKNTEYDKYPRYVIIGGFVFTPLTQNYLHDGFMTTFMNSSLNAMAEEFPSDEREEVVILSQVLATKHNKGFHKLHDWVVETINGKKFKNFDEFYAQLNQSEGDFIELSDEDGFKVLIDKKHSEETRNEVLETYRINVDRSVDIQMIDKRRTVAVK